MYSTCVCTMMTTSCQRGRAYSLWRSAAELINVNYSYLHIISQHVWVVDDKRIRQFCSEFVYSSLFDRMITWPSDADDYCRWTEKRLSWHSRILQRLRNSKNYTVSVGGRLQDKVHHLCIALACALWRHVNVAVHIHFGHRLQSWWTSTIYAEETYHLTARLGGRWQEKSTDIVLLWIHVQFSTWQNDCLAVRRWQLLSIDGKTPKLA